MEQKTAHMIDVLVTQEADSLSHEDKQAVREKICLEIINKTHEDTAWYNAMQDAMETHRRDEFPCMRKR